MIAQLATLALFSAVTLGGVTGEKLRARAFFDANNVKVGDPMTLTLDFIGEADFSQLHPPALSRELDAAVWRLDDRSAKTETFDNARRLTYRVRPLKAGVIWLEALEFEYTGKDGRVRKVTANPVPVHAREGEQVSVAGMDAAAEPAAAPPPLTELFGDEALDDDTRFAWRKAMAAPSADAFRAFAFPAGRLNEAAMAIAEGDSRRALAIYRRLEWRVGQTPEIERGIVAALAERYDNPAVELPVWRQVLRPVLRFAFWGRLVITLSALLALLLGWFVCGRVVRRLAVLALVALSASSAVADDDPFSILQRQMEQMHQRVLQMQEEHQRLMSGAGGGFTFTLGGGEEERAVEIDVRLSTSCAAPQVGERFELLLEMEYPKDTTVENLRFEPSDWFGLKVAGETELRTAPAGTNAAVKTVCYAIPVRYDVPYRGELAITASGMASRRTSRNGGRMTFSVSTSFAKKSAPVTLDIRPLPTAGQPEDFSGIIADTVRAREILDQELVGTNDVIVLTYAVEHDGRVPQDYLPPGAAYEWRRIAVSLGKPGGGARTRKSAPAPLGEQVEWVRYFIADGAEVTPKVSFSYYSPADQQYHRVEIGGKKRVR